MSIHENSAIARRILEDYFNHGNEAAWDTLTHPDVAVHGVTGDVRGAAAYKAFYSQLRSAFPNMHFSVEDVIAADDKVVVRGIEAGTMEGSFMGMPASGKSYTVAAVQIMRLDNGKLVEMWGFRDTGSMMRQLDIVRR